MAFTKRFTYIAAPMLIALGGAAATTGCGEDGLPSNPAAGLCCDSFEVGADLSGVSFGLEGEAATNFKAFAQAMADLSAVGAATLADIEIACLNMATDMGADKDDITAAKSQGGTERVKALCSLATAQIDAKFGASGTLSAHGELVIDFEPPSCSASVSASADCSASCEASVGCDCNIEANPPTCEGGTLEVSCEGSCEVSAESPRIACEGSCQGSCEGTCQADVGASVACDGKCEGTCTAGAGADETGVQADGSCKGQCEGTCEIRAGAGIECEGTCQGTCDATCEAAPGSASAKCSGTCSGSAEPLKCEGGTLKSSCECEAAADCNASCEASASAKAECHPPSVSVVFNASGSGQLDAELQAELNASIASIKANLPNILVALKARGEAFLDGVQASIDVGLKLAADAPNLSGEAVFCAPKILAAGQTAVANMQASVDASIQVAGALDIN